MRMGNEDGEGMPVAGEFEVLNPKDLAPVEAPTAPPPGQAVVSGAAMPGAPGARVEAAGATAENLPEFMGRRGQAVSALRILEETRKEAANSGIDVNEIDLSRRFVNVGEGPNKRTLELTPENFVSLWSGLLESARPEQQEEILGLVKELVTGDGKTSLAARLFVEYGRRRPDRVSDKLNTGLEAVISKLRDGEEISPEIAKGLAIAAKQEASDKISLWNIIFWILGGLTEVGSRGADMVINEVVSVTGGGR